MCGLGSTSASASTTPVALADVLENGYRVLSGGSGMTDSRVSKGCTTQPWPKLAQHCGPA
jgi:hypothetical protein